MLNIKNNLIEMKNELGHIINRFNTVEEESLTLGMYQ